MYVISRRKINEIKKLRSQGLGYRTIARELGIHRDTARKYARLLDADMDGGIESQPIMSNRLSKNEISRIQALRAEGLGFRTIARTLKINRETARKYARAYDAKLKEIDADVTNVISNPSTKTVLGFFRKYILPKIAR